MKLLMEAAQWKLKMPLCDALVEQHVPVMFSKHFTGQMSALQEKTSGATRNHYCFAKRCLQIEKRGRRASHHSEPSVFLSVQESSSLRLG
jgi:hypothetical protein